MGCRRRSPGSRSHCRMGCRGQRRCRRRHRVVVLLATSVTLGCVGWWSPSSQCSGRHSSAEFREGGARPARGRRACEEGGGSVDSTCVHQSPCRPNRSGCSRAFANVPYTCTYAAAKTKEKINLVRAAGTCGYRGVHAWGVRTPTSTPSGGTNGPPPTSVRSLGRTPPARSDRRDRGMG